MPLRTTELSSLSLFLVLILSLEIAAQDLSSVKSGDRIRIALATDVHDKKTGVCDSLLGDAIIMTPEDSGKPVTVPLAAIASLEVCRAKKRKTWSGAGIGVAVGASVGGIIGAAIGKSSDPAFAGLHALAGGVLGASSGLLLGAVIGSQIKGEQWEEMPVRASP